MELENKAELTIVLAIQFEGPEAQGLFYFRSIRCKSETLAHLLSRPLNQSTQIIILGRQQQVYMIVLPPDSRISCDLG